MTLKELKDFVNRLPESFDHYQVENAEYVGGNKEDDVKYRLDKPIIAIYVREDTEEILMMNKPMGE